MSQELSAEAINALVNAYHGSPFDVLGAHPLDDNTLVVRAFRPTAKSLRLVHLPKQRRYEMKKIHEAGLFEVQADAGDWGGANYQFEAQTYEGETETFHDPYAFPSQISDFDMYLLRQGKHLESYTKLGAHLMTVDGVAGVQFAVWAPNAQRVSVIGPFNRWDARCHPMRRLGDSGFWDLFIPGLAEYALYKFDVKSWFQNFEAQKMDPYGFFTELRPRTASLVYDLDKYQWGDGEWMAARKARTTEQTLAMPMNIYEVHLGSWKYHEGGWQSYRQLAETLIPYIKDMGYTHIELMPITEYPFDGSWGYQVTGYFAATSRHGRPEDFMYFVDQCHQNGIGIILDWVPAHFPKDGVALSYFDGTHLYEHADARRGEHPDWGTYIFNYGRVEVRNFLIASALFWLKKYHLDGLRVDAVSSMLYLDFGRKQGEWLPNQYGGRENIEAIEFLREMNTAVYEHSEGGFTIAEESTSWGLVSRPPYVGGLGFTFKWNMGWMHDVLEYMKKDPVHRRYHHHQMTFAMMYAYNENFILSLSHDEVVHLKGSLMEKMAGDWWQKFANLRLLIGYQLTHPGKSLVFMGQEFGQWREWSEARQLDWYLLEEFPTHRGLHQWSKDANHFYLAQPALYENDFDESGFKWIEPNDAEQSILSFIRFADDPADFVVVVVNFTPIPRYSYRIGVPATGFYEECLNSDAAVYGGSNMGNSGGKHSEPMPFHGQPYSLDLTLPPLSILILKLKGE